MDDLVSYNNLMKKLVTDENEEYVPDSSIVSEAIYDCVNGVTADSYFLYAVDTFPFAYIAIASDSEQLLYYDEVTIEKNMSQKLEVSFEEESEQFICEYATCYMKIRDFVFKEQISDEQKKDLNEYIQIFNKIIAGDFVSYYLKAAANFMQWYKAVV